jgi:hypothetical protein
VLPGGLAIRTLFVSSKQAPGGHSIPFACADVLAFDVDVVDGIIERDGNTARFVSLVLWGPGEPRTKSWRLLVRANPMPTHLRKSADGLGKSWSASRSYV